MARPVILNPVPDKLPNPDCPYCGGEGTPSFTQRIIGDERSYPACPRCDEGPDVFGHDDHPYDEDDR